MENKIKIKSLDGTVLKEAIINSKGFLQYSTGETLPIRSLEMAKNVLGTPLAYCDGATMEVVEEETGQTYY